MSGARGKNGGGSRDENNEGIVMEGGMRKKGEEVREGREWREAESIIST